MLELDVGEVARVLLKVTSASKKLKRTVAAMATQTAQSCRVSLGLFLGRHMTAGFQRASLTIVYTTAKTTSV